jgi:hypothetical protein
MSDIRSSKDFWEEIEPKLNVNAKLLDFSGTEKKVDFDGFGEMGDE